MRSLGLLPPYTAHDVKQAYLARVKVTHPDAGGDVAAFCQLQEDFERAIEYTKCRSNPLRWIASRVDRYVAQQKIIAEIESLGGNVELGRVDWLRETYGDFAQLAQKIVGTQLRGPHFGDEILIFLIQRRTLLPRLRKLDLAFSRVTDEGLQYLHAFRRLRHLNLQGTRITNRGLTALRLPAMEVLNVQGTSISWWSLAKLRWRGPSLAVVTPGGRLKESRNGSYRGARSDAFVQTTIPN